VAEPRNGTFGVTAALQAAGHGLDFDAVWLDWILANYASTDSYWGYAALRGRRIRTYRAPALPFADIEGMVSRRWGTVGVVVRPTTGGRQNIRVDVAGDENGRLRVWGYAMRGAVGEAVYVPLDSRQVGQLVVPDVDSVAVLVGRTSPLGGSFRMSAASYEPSVVAVAAAAVVPERTVLLPAYPNPFNAGTVVPFGLAGTAHVELAVLNVLGQRVALLLAESLPAGVYRVAWDGRSDAGSAVGSGTYIVSLQAGGTSLARTVSVAR